MKLLFKLLKRLFFGLVDLMDRWGPTRKLAMGLFTGLAALTGVPAPIRRRANAMLETSTLKDTTRFLFCFIAVRTGFKANTVGIAERLDGDDEVNAAIEVFEQAVAKRRDVNARRHLLQLKNPPLDDPELRKFVTSTATSALRSLTRTNRGRDKYFDAAEGFQVLLELKRLFAARNTRFFLVSGTLLGAVRNGDLLDSDYDIDIGVFADEAGQTDIAAIFSGHASFLVRHGAHRVSVKHESGVEIDVFLHYIDGDRCWHGTEIHRWDNTRFELGTVEMRGEQFNVPADCELYLSENYGNWQHPVAFFDFSFNTPNRSYQQSTQGLLYLHMRLLNSLSKQQRYIAEQCAKALKAYYDLDLLPYFPSSEQRRVPNRRVITFGTFDLFHYGHLRILQRAAQRGDYLMVGVSSDALNYSKKQEYPTYDEDHRMQIVEAMACVDEVFLEESLELKREYILEHKASVLVMGDDWRGRFDFAADICEVVYLPRTENISTTATKEVIKATV